jgi:hypothetical protein
MTERQFRTILIAGGLAIVVGALIGCSKYEGPTGSDQVTVPVPPQPQTVTSLVEPPVLPPVQTTPRDGVSGTLAFSGGSLRHVVSYDFISNDPKKVIVLACYTPPGNGAGRLLAATSGTQSPLRLTNILANEKCGQILSIQCDAAVGPRIPANGDVPRCPGSTLAGHVYARLQIVSGARANTQPESQPYA